MTGPAKFITVRWNDNTWQTVGTPRKPIHLRTPDNTWQLFGNGPGKPLRLRLPDGTWQIISRAGSGDPRNKTRMAYPPDRDQYPTYGMPAQHGWTTERTDYVRDNGDAGAYYNPNDNRPGGAFTGARSYSFTGGSNSGVGQERNVTLLYGWYVVPIGILKHDALNYMATPAVQNVFPHPYLYDMGIDFILDGYSVIVHREPWADGYTNLPYFMGLANATGHILYQGHTAQTEGPYHWRSPYEGIYPGTNLVYDFPTVPVVRNKPLVKESGVEIWTGSLNTLGTTLWNQNRQPVTTTYKLDLNTDGGIQFHFYTDDPAEPLPLHDANAPRTYDNSLQIQIIPWFSFGYGDE